MVMDVVATCLVVLAIIACVFTLIFSLCHIVTITYEDLPDEVEDGTVKESPGNATK